MEEVVLPTTAKYTLHMRAQEEEKSHGPVESIAAVLRPIFMARPVAPPPHLDPLPHCHGPPCCPAVALGYTATSQSGTLSIDVFAGKASTCRAFSCRHCVNKIAVTVSLKSTDANIDVERRLLTSTSPVAAAVKMYLLKRAKS